MKQYLFGAAVVILGLTATTSGQADRQKISGYLVDTVCADGHATEPGYVEKHDKRCNLMDVCVKSGYSLVTADKKVLHFDSKGNEQALALVKATDKDKEWKVVVTGKVNGQTIEVNSIALE
jgi:hypothetical protein